MINKQSQQDHIYGGKVFPQHCSIVLNKKCLTMSNLSSTDSSPVSLLRLEKVGTCTALHWKRRRKDGFNVFTNQSILHTYLHISRDFAIYSSNYVSARILAEIADRIPDRRSKDENTEKYKRLSPDVFHKFPSVPQIMYLQSVPYHIRLSTIFNAKIRTQYAKYLVFSANKIFYQPYEIF